MLSLLHASQCGDEELADVLKLLARARSKAGTEYAWKSVAQKLAFSELAAHFVDWTRRGVDSTEVRSSLEETPLARTRVDGIVQCLDACRDALRKELFETGLALPSLDAVHWSLLYSITSDSAEGAHGAHFDVTLALSDGGSAEYTCSVEVLNECLMQSRDALRALDRFD